MFYLLYLYRILRIPGIQHPGNILKSELLRISQKTIPKRRKRQRGGVAIGWYRLRKWLHGGLQWLAQRSGAHAYPCRKDHHRLLQKTHIYVLRVCETTGLSSDVTL